jgi:cobalt/nickel transport system ATP-binding protein
VVVNLLAVRHLHLRRTDGQALLHDVSFTLTVGERVALIGPNGAGKTTLFKALAGALAPSAGQVLLDGAPLATEGFNPGVALVFQHAEDQLFCPTVADDVSFGARALGLRGKALEQAVGAALERCGLAGLGERMVHQLSGGERRLACLAGALVMAPRLLLLDEPSASLDLRNRRRLIRHLADLDQALLLATHDLELVREVCTRVLLLDAGRLHADGPADAILSNAALMEAHGQEIPTSLRLR